MLHTPVVHDVGLCPGDLDLFTQDPRTISGLGMRRADASLVQKRTGAVPASFRSGPSERVPGPEAFDRRCSRVAMGG